MPKLTIEEANALVQEIASTLPAEAQATVITKLTSISESYVEMVRDEKTAIDESAKLKKDNEDLRKCNLELFMKIPAISGGNNASGSGQPNGKERTDKKSYDDLFDQNGKLK